MIRAAVLCPSPPLLFRELGGIADPVADLRAACRAALDGVLSHGVDSVVLVAGVADPARIAAGSIDAGASPDVRRFGTAGVRTGPGLPLPLGVGRRLLDDAGWTGSTELVGLGLDASSEELREVASALTSRSDRTAVLLLGEGSARRVAGGPGALDERAFAFDAGVVRALDAGDASALAGLDADLARDLLVGGRSSLRLLGELGLVVAPVVTRIDHEGDPYGVEYVVATWRW